MIRYFLWTITGLWVGWFSNIFFADSFKSAKILNPLFGLAAGFLIGSIFEKREEKFTASPLLDLNHFLTQIKNILIVLIVGLIISAIGYFGADGFICYIIFLHLIVFHFGVWRKSNIKG